VLPGSGKILELEIDDFHVLVLDHRKYFFWIHLFLLYGYVWRRIKTRFRLEGLGAAVMT
jgi:hypothetical protein